MTKIPTMANVSDVEECVLRLQKSLTPLEGKKNVKMSGINAEEYLKAGDDLMVFAGVTEEDILSEITDEMENDDDDTDKNIAVFIDIPVSSSISSVPGIFFKPFIQEC
ncbi:hypothetical protein AVEN_207230-1 [Araneus ventricosus]|uniref:Uncharacterized protein n=1 Tax=Araneus ventricosus TaxID=182803 RepID=A0A4Y2I992_ARAVE|nr:hypothetical protein AVEN_207230-1 [Araneus ventricosus]